MNKLNYININIGTNSENRQSRGNSLPFVSVPHAMQSFSVQTKQEAGGWFYNPYHPYMEGVRLCNQPSPWVGDYGQVVFFPFSVEANVSPGMRYSTYKKSIEKPSQLKFYLMRYQIECEVIPSTYGGRIKCDYKNDNTKKFLIQTFDNDAKFKFTENTVSFTVSNCGWHGNKAHENFKKHYFVEFDKNIMSHDLKKNDENAFLELEMADSFIANITCSYISVEQARYNQIDELTLDSEQLLDYVENRWEELLGAIDIETNDEEKKLFYSNLYRSLLFPRRLHEPTKDGLKYFDFENNKIQSGKMYTDNGFWDTYRTTFPLYSMVYPELFKEFAMAIIDHYQNTGWTPRWLCPYEIGLMPSTLVDSIIAEAIMKDMLDEEYVKIGTEAIVKNATVDANNDLNGRKGILDYNKLGYVPFDKYHETGSTSLDYYYLDYCIYSVLNKSNDKDAELYFKRSKGYENMFDSKSKFLIPRDSYGNFREDFNPDVWGTDYCESSGWSNNFSVVHDIDSLVSLFGDKTEVMKRLDEIFNDEPRYDVGKYGFEIHEMTEVACIDLGRFGISNQPSFNLPYTYFAIGENDLAIESIEKGMSTFTKDDFPGDEDNGSMSSWFILNAIGLFPYCPVDAKYYKFKSRYDSVTINGQVMNDNTSKFELVNHKDLLSEVNYES